MKHSIILVLCAAMLAFSLLGCAPTSSVPVAPEGFAPEAPSAKESPVAAAPEAPLPDPGASDASLTDGDHDETAQQALPEAPQVLPAAQVEEETAPSPAAQAEKATPEPVVDVVETPAQSAYFYNPNPSLLLNCVHFTPHEVWYEDGALIAKMHVTNGYNHTVYNIRNVELALYDGNENLIASGNFGAMEGAVIGSMASITWTFKFHPDTVAIPNADLSRLLTRAGCSNSY